MASWNTLTRKLSVVKLPIIRFGGYKAARWVADHVVDRSRLRAHKKRLDLFQSLVSPGDLCFDVGANIGDYTAALIAAGARVVAIDPQPSSVMELRARFKGDKRVVVEPIALGSKCGGADFYVRDLHGTSSFIKNWETSEYIEKIHVPVRTIESLIAIYGKPNYVKIDVEGYELEVIRGLESKVDLLSFEYHLTADDCAAKLKIIKTLARFGTLSFNLLPDFASTFRWKQFCSAEEFHDIFPSKLAKSGEFSYGDIFVKIA
jgi:FkbM family methyltransferase